MEEKREKRKEKREKRKEKREKRKEKREKAMKKRIVVESNKNQYWQQWWKLSR